MLYITVPTSVIINRYRNSNGLVLTLMWIWGINLRNKIKYIDSNANSPFRGLYVFDQIRNSYLEKMLFWLFRNAKNKILTIFEKGCLHLEHCTTSVMFFTRLKKTQEEKFAFNRQSPPSLEPRGSLCRTLVAFVKFVTLSVYAECNVHFCDLQQAST